MKEKITSLFTAITSRPKTALLVLLLIVVGVYVAKGKSPVVENVTVSFGDIVEEVSVTGKTVAVKDLSLGFDKGGRVVSAPVAVGDRVTEGQIIASLDASELSANRAKFTANLAEAEVALSKSRRTSTDSFDDARSNAISRVKDSYSKADDALRNNVDQFFKNPRQSTTYIQFSFKDGATEYNFPIDNTTALALSSERYTLERLLIDWNTSLLTIDTASDINPYVVTAESNLNRIKTFLNQVAYVTNSVQASEFRYQATVDGYKQTVSIARTNVGTAISNLLLAKEKISAAPTQTTITNNQFDEVASAQARVDSVKADLASIDAQIAKTIIRSPISGLVTKQDAKVGEIITANAVLIGVISDKNLEIEANVSEVNIGKVAVGNLVEVSFDAFPGKMYTGKVLYIDPAETIVDNVVNYKVKVSLDGDGENIKSGLTANLKIKTAEKKQVLKVPLYSVTQDGETFSVQKVIGEKNTLEKVTVITGLIGNNGNVEIISGVKNGETIRVTVPSK